MDTRLTGGSLGVDPPSLDRCLINEAILVFFIFLVCYSLVDSNWCCCRLLRAYLCCVLYTWSVINNSSANVCYYDYLLKWHDYDYSIIIFSFVIQDKFYINSTNYKWFLGWHLFREERSVIIQSKETTLY